MLEQHFEKLAYFAAVADAGGFAAAARRLRLSQSTISTAVKIIEGELGTELFERSRKGVTLTGAGQSLLDTYSVLKARVRDLESEIKSSNDRKERHIVVGTHDTVATGIWPELVRGVNAVPGLSVALNTNPSASRLMQLLRERAYDCILVAEPEESDEWDVVDIGSVNYRLFVSAASESSMARDQLIASGVIGHAKALAGRRILSEERWRSAGIPANPHLIVDSLEAVKEMVLEGLGPGVLPVELCRRYEKRGLIKRLKTPGFDQEELGRFQLGLCTPRGRIKDRYYQELAKITRGVLNP